MSSEGSRSQVGIADESGMVGRSYERPTLTPIGNLNDVLAASTQQLDSDNGVVCGQATGHIACS